MRKPILIHFGALLCALLSWTSSVSAQELSNFSRGLRTVSPEIGADSTVFRLKADYATIVKLAGTWMGRPGSVDMRRGEGNVWSVKVPTPAPEIYTYNFIVDGVAVNDPLNVLVQRDGTRYLSMLIVPGERSENYYEATRHGTVSHPWYTSGILGYDRRLTVYTPYGYEDKANAKKKYPVLYLLHGAGGDEEAWTSMGRAAQILDNLIEKGLAEPMIVVMPNGNPGQQAARTLGIAEKQIDRRDESFRDAYVRSLVEEIVPFVDKNFRTVAKKSSRAIAGLSMGGGHTTRATILYPDAFDYICPLSCGIRDSAELDGQLQGIKKAGYKLYWVGCGKADFAWPGTEVLDKALERNGMEHTIYASEGGHTWYNWRLYLNTFARLLFK